MKLKHLIFTFLFIASCNFAIGQVQFEAKVSKQTLGVNERLRVDFEMNQDGDNFRPPNFDNFRVVGGPNQSISNSWINGKRSFSKTYSYFLAPQGTGKFTIAQATIDVEGQTYKTVPIQVQVTSATANPTDGNNTEIVASDNVHLVAEVSKNNPYLNEAITVTYKLYVSNEVSITSQWREIDTPKYADFWSQNIDNQNNLKVQNGKYKGQDYRYLVLRTTVLYPQKTGKLEIEPLTLDIPIDVPGTRRDIFGRRNMERVNKTISAGSREIDVKPLPLEGKPEGFTGAVGEFTFTVNSNKTVLDANESLELDVKVSGKGNLKLFQLPSVKLASSLEAYEPVRSENVNTTAAGQQGNVVEKYTIVPQFKGEYAVKPITFSYFDPSSEKYKTINSNEIVISVENGPITAENNGAITTENGNKKPVIMDKDQFKYIKLDGNLASTTKEPFFKSGLFWSLLGAPFLLIPLFLFVGRKRKERLGDVAGNRLRKANRLAKKYLGEAKKNMGNTTVFYEALERALHNYLKATLHIETSEMSKDHIAKLLSDKSVEPNVVNDFIGLLKSCEFARYAATTTETVQQDYNNAVSVISDIDKQIR